MSESVFPGYYLKYFITIAIQESKSFLSNERIVELNMNFIFLILIIFCHGRRIGDSKLKSAKVIYDNPEFLTVKAYRV